MPTPDEHALMAEAALTEAHALMQDKDYLQYDGYGRINVLLRLADVHARLAARRDEED